jgi:hypothetical protein
MPVLTLAPLIVAGKLFLDTDAEPLLTHAPRKRPAPRESAEVSA